MIGLMIYSRASAAISHLLYPAAAKMGQCGRHLIDRCEVPPDDHTPISRRPIREAVDIIERKTKVPSWFRAAMKDEAYTALSLDA